MIAIELAEMTWYGACHRFHSGEQAKAAFDHVHNFDKSGALDIGLYRHQRIGLDDEAVLVSVVGHHREGVEQAERLLGGKEIELHLTTWLEMIKRRAEVVGKLLDQDKKAGRYRIKHSPEGDAI